MNNSVTTALGAVFDTELVAGKNRQGVVPTAATSGGCAPYSLVLAATNNANVVKNAPGQIFFIDVANISVAAYRFFVKLYDQTGAPNPASDVPKYRFGFTPDVDPFRSFPMPLEFTVGIAILVVQGLADTNNVAIAATADGVVNMGVK